MSADSTPRERTVPPRDAPAEPSTPPDPPESSATPETPESPPWDLGHLRPGLLATLALAVVGVPALWLWLGYRGGLGGLLGFAIVAAFFSVSAVVVAWAARNNDRMALPVALASYLVKITILGVVLITLPADGPFDRRALAYGVLAGILLWVVVHVRWVITRRMFYVDYRPPAGATEDSPVASADAPGEGRTPD